MKSQNGMSHIAWILAIVVIIGLVICALFFSKIKLEDEVLKMYETDMLLIQGKVKVLSKEAIVEGNDDGLKGKKIEENLENETIKKLLEDSVISKEEKDFSKYYIIDKQTLDEMGLTDVKIRDGFYIVNYNTDEIIYAKGITIENNTYYKLTEIKEANSKKENQNEVINETTNETTTENETNEVRRLRPSWLTW